MWWKLLGEGRTLQLLQKDRRAIAVFWRVRLGEIILGKWQEGKYGKRGCQDSGPLHGQAGGRGTRGRTADAGGNAYGGGHGFPAAAALRAWRGIQGLPKRSPARPHYRAGPGGRAGGVLWAGDFEPVFRARLGENAPLSATSVTRLKEEWQTEYETWCKRRLDVQRYLYGWGAGVYLAAGDEDEKTALLCVLGLREDGEKELLGIGLGYRESKESWAAVLRDLRDRGMGMPLLVIGDGALGIWAALREIWPESRSQRCWNHRTINVLDKLPKRLWAKVRNDLRKA